MRILALFYNFANLMLALVEDPWIHTPASAFNLLPYVALIKLYEENLALFPYVVKKGRSVLIFFSDNCGQSSLLLNQNLTSGNFLNVNGNVEFEVISMNTLHCNPLVCLIL